MEKTHIESEIEKDLNLGLIARVVVEGFITGLHKSPFHGFSVEFAEHRLYNTGSSIRSVDWKLFARTEKLFIKRYEEETNLRCQIILDRSSSMYFPEGKFSKMYFSVLASASLMYLLQKQRDAFGLSIFSNIVENNIPCRATNTHLKILLSELETLLKSNPIQKSTSSSSSIHSLAESFHKRSLVIIFSDLLDNIDQPESFMSSLQHLRHNKHEVILFHVLDYSKELNLKFENKPYHFIDLETGRELKVNPLQIRDSYQNKMQAFQSLIQEKCGQNGIEYVATDISLGFDLVLTNYLIKRNRMNI
jgi:uncharacterized protein (DUF58 family)